MKKLNVGKTEHALYELMDRAVQEKHMLGSFCLIHQSGRPVLQLSVGSAKMDGSPIDEHSIFRMASMSKNICSIAVMQLIEKEKLSLDTKLSDFYPGFKEKWIRRWTDKGEIAFEGKAETPLTVRHLVTHTSGLGVLETVPSALSPSEYSLQNIAKYYADEATLLFDPGSYWAYSGLGGCDVLGNLIERISDMPYEEYVKRYITEPLNMADTGFSLSEEQWGRMVDVLSHDAEGNNLVTDKEKHRFLPLIPKDYPTPGGGMASTAADYIKINDMLLQGGSLGKVQILRPESVRQICTPLIPQGMPGIFFPWMTFGVLVYVRKGVKHVPDGCFGWGGFYGTYTLTDPENELSIVWMKNSNVLATVFEPTGETAFETAIYQALE